jgi:beta-lactamase superfamily II metal-dependent hydrolase
MAAKKNSGASTKKAGKADIRVRMYRVGFGDCFLVTFGGKHHVLIDCGVHAKGNINLNGSSLIEKAFDNIRLATGDELDLIIATHAHQDHVSGFGKFADQFSKFKRIGEVWMPWTDDLSNPTAVKWHAKKKALAAHLARAAAVRRDAAAQAAVENSSPDAKAMNALRHGFGKTKEVKYLKAGENVPTVANIAGLSARILGPPEDQGFIGKMDPPTTDHYLRMAADAAMGLEVAPFAKWEIKPNRLPKGWERVPANLITHLEQSAGFAATAAAFSLDKFLNNTSIVALFSWNGKTMLFPGDAQYGDWSSWYKKTGTDLLGNICFYKVAHHGSWNATPKGALEEMPHNHFAAMVSTQDKPWASIPRAALISALDSQTGGRLMRSDSIPVPVKAPSGPKISTMNPAFTPGNYKQGEYWVDYNVR